jgi:hypothetical protein
MNFQNLLRCGWFDRLWIIQEIKAANPGHATIQCGEAVIKWSSFQSAMGYLSAFYDEFMRPNGRTSLFTSNDLQKRILSLQTIWNPRVHLYHIEDTRESLDMHGTKIPVTESMAFLAYCTTRITIEQTMHYGPLPPT